MRIRKCVAILGIVLIGDCGCLSWHDRLSDTDTQIDTEPGSMKFGDGSLSAALMEKEWTGASVMALSDDDAAKIYLKYFTVIQSHGNCVGLGLLKSGMAQMFQIDASPEMQKEDAFTKAYAFVRCWPECVGYSSFYLRYDIVFLRLDGGVDRIWPDQELDYSLMSTFTIY